MSNTNDVFDKKEYKRKYDEISLSQLEKNIIKAKMYQAADGEYIASPIKYKNRRNCKWVGRIAVFTAIMLIIGIVFVQPSTDTKKNKAFSTSNFFTITANAAEQKIKSEDIIGLYSGENSFGPISDKKLYNRQGKEDYCSDFKISEFVIEGRGIKSISLKSNKKYCYFNLTDSKLFSDYNSLENSQYTKKQREDASWGLIYCDGFSCKVKDTGKKQRIDLGNLFYYTIETDRTDKEIDGWMEKLGEIQNRQWEIRSQRHMIYGDDVAIPLTEEEDRLDWETTKIIDKFNEKTLRNASIDLTVNYTDGTKDKEVINVDCVIENCEGKIIYDSGLDGYPLPEKMNKEYHHWIAFRLKEQ